MSAETSTVSVTTAKRARACDACHSIKIKCTLGSSQKDPPCERCVRLGKSCTITPPKRQKDRVAELEAQVEALTRLLGQQGISNRHVDSITAPSPLQSAPSKDTPESSSAASSRKRRREETSEPPTSSDAASSTNIAEDEEDVDKIVPREVQIRIVDKYIHDMVIRAPFVPLRIHMDYDDLHSKHDTLLKAILFAAGGGILDPVVLEIILCSLMETFSSDEFVASPKNIEDMQAVLITLLYFRLPRQYVPFRSKPLIFVALELAESNGFRMGISIGPPTSTGYRHVDACHELQSVWRVWNTCYILAACTALGVRVPSEVEWNNDDAINLQLLDYAKDHLPSDKFFCQVVSAVRLVEDITSQMGYYKGATVGSLDDPETQARIARLKDKITDWTVQVPHAAYSPKLEVWKYIAIINLYECVLHTSTNKQSFAVPYLTDHLSATDFPRPVVGPNHIVAIQQLTYAIHGALNIFFRLEIDTFVYLPALVYSARALQAAFLLVKLYVAITGCSNTYGAFIDVNSLKLEEYLDGIISLSHKVRLKDPDGGARRIVGASVRLKEWVASFKEALTVCQSASLVFPMEYDLQGLDRIEANEHTDPSFPHFSELEWSRLVEGLDFPDIIPAGTFPDHA